MEFKRHIKGLIKRLRERHRLRKSIIAVASFLALFTLVGFLILPIIFKSILLKQLSETLHGEVVIEKVRVNPYVLSLTVKGLAIKEPKSAEAILSVDETFINLQAKSAFKRALILKELSIKQPYLYVSRNKEGDINLLSILPDEETQKAPLENDQNTKPLTVEIDNIQLTGVRVLFSDLLKHSEFQTTLESDLSINNFSTSNNKESTFVLTLKTEANETARIDGKFSLDPLSSEGTFDLKKISLSKYSPYYRDSVLFDIKDGDLDILANYTYKEKETKISLLLASLRSLQLKTRNEKEEFLEIPIASVKETDIDILKKQITLGELTTKGGNLIVNRLQDGKLNLETLVPASSSMEVKSEQNGNRQDTAPWCLTLKDAVAEEYTVKFQDEILSEPVAISMERIKLQTQNISTVENSQGRVFLSLRLNKKGIVSAEGPFGINPVFADVKVNLKDIQMQPFEPYLREEVAIILKEGNISTTSNLSLSYSETDGLKATYQGEASISNFSSMDKSKGNDFLKWESLHLGDIDFGYNPSYLKINEVAIANFYSRLVINPDATINILDIFEKDEQLKEENQEKMESAEDQKEEFFEQIEIKTVTVQGGQINFTDTYIKPNYSANLFEVGGRISGLSSKGKKLADVNLRGKLGKIAPLEITGKIDPLREDLYADLKIVFEDIDLSPLTPYSKRYLGYNIQKGKLFLNLEYKIEKRKLGSRNILFIDQFMLGDKVESPDAVKLPVRLAIALLKDRKGEIHLSVPVEGDLDDPRFGIGKIILNVFVNAIKKTVTSPFALIGSVFGGGKELSYVEFDYGESEITEHNAKKLDILVKALYERPLLKLEIQGHVDTEEDRLPLRQSILVKKLKAQKLSENTRKGLPSRPIEEIQIDPEEYDRYLEMAYDKEEFPKPRDEKGNIKELPASEMEKLMLTHIVVEDDELRQLAYQRASEVKDYILSSEKVEPKRIFLSEPKSLSPKRIEELRDSRVDLYLK